MLVASIRTFSHSLPTAVDDELDPNVLELCRQGQRAALEQFVRCYQRRVFAFLSRSLGYGLSVDDLAQDVFIRAFRALSEFDPSGRARLSTWLFTIAYHVLVDARRRQKTDYALFSNEPTSSDTDNPERQLWRRQLNTALARAVAELTPDQRDAFILSEFHDLSISEIAKVTQTLESTVKTRLFRARGHLRHWLAKLWETDR
jgi:RNA polymerase sigma-70 factor, ECF subfamily